MSGEVLAGMNARKIIEQLCSSGDDVWQRGYLHLYGSTIGPILEAWSPESKDRIVQDNARKGVRLIDHVVLDDYDLTLWKVPVNPAKVLSAPSGVLWSVAVNSEQHDPTQLATQHAKFPGSSLRHTPASSFVQVLRDWIADYGKARGGIGRSAQVGNLPEIARAALQGVGCARRPPGWVLH